MLSTLGLAAAFTCEQPSRPRALLPLTLLPAHCTPVRARLCAPGGAVQDLYTWSADARLITEQLTVAFLQRLQQHLANNGVNVNLTSSRNMTEILDMFEGVARDVLSYLRSSNSKGLLPLLRQFATHGTVTLSDVDPDVFRDEVFGILNLTRLGEWYSDTTNRHPAMLTRPPAAWNAAGGVSEAACCSSTSCRAWLATTRLINRNHMAVKAAAVSLWPVDAGRCDRAVADGQHQQPAAAGRRGPALLAQAPSCGRHGRSRWRPHSCHCCQRIGHHACHSQPGDVVARHAVRHPELQPNGTAGPDPAARQLQRQPRVQQGRPDSVPAQDGGAAVPVRQNSVQARQNPGRLSL